MFQEEYARRDRAQVLLKTVTLVEVAGSEHYKHGKLSAYEVLLGTEKIGRVLQAVHHTYKVHNRVRYQDRYTVRWQYDWPKLASDVRSLYYDTRKKAILELLVVALKKGRVT